SRFRSPRRAYGASCRTRALPCELATPQLPSVERCFAMPKAIDSVEPTNGNVFDTGDAVGERRAVTGLSAGDLLEQAAALRRAGHSCWPPWCAACGRRRPNRATAPYCLGTTKPWAGLAAAVSTPRSSARRRGHWPMAGRG